MRKIAVVSSVLLSVVIFTTATTAVEKREVEYFSTTKDVPQISQWFLVKETTLSGNPKGLFAARYYRAPENAKNLGPLGMTVFLREVPELGILYQAWNIKGKDNGVLDFSLAVFAHYLDDGKWAVAKPGFVFAPYIGKMEPTSFRVYRTVIIYHPETDPKLKGKQKTSVEYEGVERYGDKTLKQVVLKLLDPDGKEKSWWLKIDFSPKKISSKEKVR